MVEQYEDEVQDALDDGDLNAAVDSLKKGLKRDPYWQEGHRILGDLYLVELNHPAYALVEYRKLRKVSDDPRPEDRLRLAWAYKIRGFEDKALEQINEISTESLSEEIDLVDRTIDSSEKLQSLRVELEQRSSQQSSDRFQKYVRDGREHAEFGNFYEAQQSFEKALNIKENTDVKVELAHCLMQRSKFPEAVRYLKEVLSNGSHPKAEKYLNDIYSRLGISEVSQGASGRELSSSEDDSRKAS